MRFILTILFLFIVAISYSEHVQADDFDRCGSEAENNKQAIRSCSRLIKGRSLSRKGRAWAHFQRAQRYESLTRYKLAISDYKKSSKYNPKSVLSHVFRGMLLTKLGKFNLAIGAYNKALKINPKNILAYGSRGVAYQAIGKHKLAMADVNRAVKAAPDYFGGYLNRGDVYRVSGQYDLAIADYDKALKLNPKSVLGLVNRGKSYYAIGQGDKGKADFKKAKALDPKVKLPDLASLKIEKAVSAAKKKADPAQEKNAEIAFWNTVKDSKDPAMFQAYLDQFPKGTFVTLAKIMMAKVEKNSR